MAIVNALIARKRHLYGSDPRGITNETIIVRNGEFSLRAEARLVLDNIEHTAGRQVDIG